MAKNTAVFSAEHVVHQALQIFGGMGYPRESEVERHYRDARLLGIGGGATEVMNEPIAKNLPLDWPTGGVDAVERGRQPEPEHHGCGRTAHGEHPDK